MAHGHFLKMTTYIVKSCALNNQKNNQNKLVKEYLTKLKSEVFRNRKDFLKIMDTLAKDFCFISFKDYREFVKACEKEKIIQFG